MADEYACWTSETRCGCPSSLVEVTGAALYEVRMSHPFTHGLANVGRGVMAILTLGISTVANGGLKALLHDEVDVNFRCTRCNTCFTRTYEICGEGKKNRVGRYSRSYCTLAKLPTEHARGRTEADMERVFDSLSGRYDLINWNCSHFSRAFWRKAFCS